jgi:hypothetical protein
MHYGNGYGCSLEVLDVIWKCLNQATQPTTIVHLLSHPYILNAPASLTKEAIHEIRQISQ